MNKAELIEVVAARIDASKKDAGEAVQAVIDAITEAVAKGQKVSISGFGVFERAARPARTYRTPSTGEAIQKLATTVPKFRPGGDFRALVAGTKDIADLVVRTVTGQGGSESGEAEKDAADEAPAPAKKAPAKRAAAKKAPAKKAASSRTAAKKAPAKRAAKAEEPAAEESPAGDPHEDMDTETASGRSADSEDMDQQ